MSRMLLGLMVWGLMSGCGVAEPSSTRQGRLELRAGQSVEGSPECGVDLPACASGKSCIAFKVDAVTRVRCLDGSTLCTDLLQCTGGTTCAVLESYPGQVVCSGTCRGEDCDSSVSSGPLP